MLTGSCFPKCQMGLKSFKDVSDWVISHAVLCQTYQKQYNQAEKDLKITSGYAVMDMMNFSNQQENIILRVSSSSQSQP